MLRLTSQYGIGLEFRLSTRSNHRLANHYLTPPRAIPTSPSNPNVISSTPVPGLPCWILYVPARIDAKKIKFGAKAAWFMPSLVRQPAAADKQVQNTTAAVTPSGKSGNPVSMRFSAYFPSP